MSAPRSKTCTLFSKALRHNPCRATVRVYDMAFFRKIVLRHDTGLGEAYIDKVWLTL
jgi:hypothetical protein